MYWCLLFLSWLTCSQGELDDGVVVKLVSPRGHCSENISRAALGAAVPGAIRGWEHADLSVWLWMPFSIASSAFKAFALASAGAFFFALGAIFMKSGGTL